MVKTLHNSKKSSNFGPPASGEFVVTSDSALPPAIPPNLRSHFRANANPLAIKIKLCKHN